jgi:hypothetical protein
MKNTNPGVSLPDLPKLSTMEQLYSWMCEPSYIYDYKYKSSFEAGAEDGPKRLAAEFTLAALQTLTPKELVKVRKAIAVMRVERKL